MSGWTNVWGALSNVVGPMTLAFVIKVTHSWGSGMFVIGAAAACGALLWLLVHPERPLLGDEVSGPPGTAGPVAKRVGGGVESSCSERRETGAEAGRVTEQSN